MRKTTLDSNPIIDAKTIKDFFIALNAKFGTNIPTDVTGAPLLVELLDVKITVKQGPDGSHILYCAQADVPSTVFGLSPDSQGVIVLKFLDQDIKIVMTKCEDS